MNWKGQPLISYETVVKLVGSTRTRSGFEVKAMLDTQHVMKRAIMVSNQQIQELNLQMRSLHPDWNYTLSPRMPAR
jgi:Rhodopirellula transposase DDE domain